jgi:phosphoheptose isomerase
MRDKKPRNSFIFENVSRIALELLKIKSLKSVLTITSPATSGSSVDIHKILAKLITRFSFDRFGFKCVALNN